MSTEIPIWVNGEIRWLSGIDKKTTCKDVVEVLLDGEGIDKSQVSDFTIMERWRKVERPLDENSKILKIWTHWGDDKKEVRLCLRRIDNEVDSGRGSPIGSGSTPSFRRKRNRCKFYGKPSLAHPEGLHPRRLAELGTFHKREYNDYYTTRNGKPPDVGDEKPTKHCAFSHPIHGNLYEIYSDNENVNCYRKSTTKSYHCPRTGKLHSTPLADYTNSRVQGKKCCSKRDSKHKVRNSENIEKLMKLILAQGATIQSQLQKLKERDEQIETIEQERHRERIEKNGRNYLLETYLGSLKEAEIPLEMEDERADDSGVNTEGGSDQMQAILRRNMERLQQNETEPDSDPSLSRVRENLNEHPTSFRRHHSGHHYRNGSSPNSVKNGTRSKSESRTIESKTTVANVALKRSLSDNSISKESELENDTNNHSQNPIDLGGNLKRTRKQFDDAVEMQKIRCQIQMWEEIFKINKKLEKEEENLVRLHVKIKKIQNENHRLAKDKERSETSMKAVENETKLNMKEGGDVERCDEHKRFPQRSVDSDGDQIAMESDYEKIKQDLKMIKSDLDSNSKEIYKNFTKLLEEDELAEQKRKCLAQLLSDFERVEQEEEMLNEMITTNKLKEVQRLTVKEDLDLTTSAFQKSNNSYEFEKATVAEPAEIVADECKILNPDERADDCQVVVNQRPEEEPNAGAKAQQFLKPKIVKISFEDTVKSCDGGSENRQEKSAREPGTVTAGALKGILKNRNKPTANRDAPGTCDMTNNQNESHKLQTSSSLCYPNNNQNNNFYQNYNSSNVVRIPQTGDVSLQNDLNYSSETWSTPYNNYTINYLYERNYTTVPQSSNFDVKTSYSLKSSHPHKMPATLHPHVENGFSHNAIVRTKVLNDNDSSTSSDTSGLCSMYSSSPSAEPPFIENGYILDTLV